MTNWNWNEEKVGEVTRDVKRLKSKLIAKALRKGLYENFGQKEVGILQDKYSEHTYKDDGVWDVIDKFNEWAMTFDDRKLTLARVKTPRNMSSIVMAHTRKTKTGRTTVRGHMRRG